MAILIRNQGGSLREIVLGRTKFICLNIRWTKKGNGTYEFSQFGAGFNLWVRNYRVLGIQTGVGTWL